MTPTTLEALARALARLEPDVFRFHKYVGGLNWVLSIVNFGGWAHAVEGNGSEVPVEIQTNDDRLLGAVWRCAVAREWNCTVSNFCGDVSAKVEFDAEIDPVQADAATPGVALALAYCDARGEKVEL